MREKKISVDKVYYIHFFKLYFVECCFFFFYSAWKHSKKNNAKIRFPTFHFFSLNFKVLHFVRLSVYPTCVHFEIKSPESITKPILAKKTGRRKKNKCTTPTEGDRYPSHWWTEIANSVRKHIIPSVVKERLLSGDNWFRVREENSGLELFFKLHLVSD